MKISTKRTLTRIENFVFNLLISALIIFIFSGSIWIVTMMLVGYFGEEGEAARIARENADVRYARIEEL